MELRLPTYLQPNPRVLIADDDAGSRVLLRTVLEREGAVVTAAADGYAVLEALGRELPDLVLLDVDMPGLTGIEVARRIRQRHPDGELPIILVTGHEAPEMKVAGLDAGATDFVTKPYDRSELVARVRAALRTRAAFDRLESAQGVLAALANAVEAKDASTEHHCARLAEFALGLGGKAGLDGPTLEALGYGAVLHDVGKIGVSEAIIRKPGALTEDEWAEMKRHSAIGAGIVDPLRLGGLIAPIVRGHHERWDGFGYPDGLRGELIPVGARIVCIVDAYDAMTHDRPYRKALSEDHARTELLDKAAKQFDPDLADLFIDYLADRDRSATGGALLAPADPTEIVVRPPSASASRSG